MHTITHKVHTQRKMIALIWSCDMHGPPLHTAESITGRFHRIVVARILSGGTLFFAKNVDNLFSRRPQNRRQTLKLPK